MTEEVKLGKWQHFKGMIVEVIGIAKHSENLEEYVVYTHDNPVKGFEGKTMWIRPKDMFLETIERDGKIIKRFEFIE